MGVFFKKIRAVIEHRYFGQIENTDLVFSLKIFCIFYTPNEGSTEMLTFFFVYFYMIEIELESVEIVTEIESQIIEITIDG